MTTTDNLDCWQTIMWMCNERGGAAEACLDRADHLATGSPEQLAELLRGTLIAQVGLLDSLAQLADSIGRRTHPSPSP